MSVKKNNFLIFGPPGSGKGTQSSLVSKNINIFHFIMSSFLSKEIHSLTENGNLIKSIIDSGNLIPDELLFDIFNLSILEIYQNFDSVLFDGIPRNLQQAKFLLGTLNTKFNCSIDLIFVINIDKKLLTQRILDRVICPQCNDSFSKDYSICEKCNVSLIKRLDDDIEIFNHRFDIYQKSSDQILNYFEQNFIPIVFLDGNLSIIEINDIIQSKINDVIHGNR